MTEEATTQSHVRAAEAEAHEAEALVAELEKRVVDGDETITVDQIDAQEKLSRFARLRLQQTQGKAERTRVAARLTAAESLREEIDAEAQVGAGSFVKKLRAIHDAEAAFRQTVADHNERITTWRIAMQDLGIPVSDGSPVPPEADGRLALGQRDHQIRAGRRVLGLLAPESFIESLRVGSDKQAVYDSLAAQLNDIPESTATHFYRGSSGGVIAVDNAFSAEDVKRLGMTKITKKEAWGE